MRRRLVVIAVACLVLAGCGGSRAARVRSPAPLTTAAATTPATRPAVTSAHPTSIARGPATSGGWRTPTQAVRAFAATYVNWTAATVAARLRALAAVSVGQARATLLIQAREATGDRALHRGGVQNSGTVQAVAPIIGRPDAYAVVTRERTGALHDAAYADLAPAWHVSIATLTRTRGGLWVLSGWQPES